MKSIYAGLGTLLIIAAGMNVTTVIVFLTYVFLYILIIWLFLGISQALYILYDDPNTSTASSIKSSFTLMKGYRWPLVGLLFLTTVALILGVLLFVIGIVVSLVLYEVARLAFYRELLRKIRQKEWQEQVNDGIS